ncbi:MAG: hypothetical protein ABTD50_14865 [Polyangiaceae bacterium]|jgi:hypothetical protein
MRLKVPPSWFRGPPWLYGAALVVLLAGSWWGLPHSESWANDAITPRSTGLFAIALPYWWGHFHTYPPLHMALLTVLCLPVTLLAALIAIGTRVPIENVLLQPALMTAIEGIARIVAMTMALGIVDSTYRIWSRLEDKYIGALAALSVVGVTPWAYYGKVGNVDIPSVFWLCLTLEQVLAPRTSPTDGERAEQRALVFATLAVLTKDQIAGALVAPIAWLVVAPAVRGAAVPGAGLDGRSPAAERWRVARALARGSLWKSAALSLALYVLISGALVNPTGWLARMRFIFGPASRDWVGFAPTLGGRIALARAILARIPELTSWPSALLSAVGIAVCVADTKRRKHLLPAAAALAFTATFNFLALRSEHRFLMVQAVLVAPYAALVVALGRHRRLGSVGAVVFFAAWAACLRAVASLDATLMADSRYAAERFLASLPANSRVEVMGGPKFLPRLPAHVVAKRVGLDALAARSAIPGVTEELGDPRLIDQRHPDYLVVSVEFATPQFFPTRPGPGAYMEASTLAFFHELALGKTSYVLAYRATCKLPWPLTCVRLHSCTGGDIAVYRPRDASPSGAASRYKVP